MLKNIKKENYITLFLGIAFVAQLHAGGTRIVKFQNHTPDVIYQIRGQNYAPGTVSDPDVKLQGAKNPEPIIPAYYVDKKGSWHSIPQEGAEKIDTEAYQAWLADYNYYDPYNPDANPYGAKDKYNGDVLSWRKLELGGTIHIQDTGEKSGNCFRSALLQKQYRIKMWNELGSNVCKRMCGSTKEKGVFITIYQHGQIEFFQDPDQNSHTKDC